MVHRVSWIMSIVKHTPLPLLVLNQIVFKPQVQDEVNKNKAEYMRAVERLNSEKSKYCQLQTKGAKLVIYVREIVNFKVGFCESAIFIKYLQQPS